MKRICLFAKGLVDGVEKEGKMRADSKSILQFLNELELSKFV